MKANLREVAVIGVGMHPFGRFLEKSVREMGCDAAWKAMRDANVTPKDIQVAYFGNVVEGLIDGQESVRGQNVLRSIGFGGIPIINVENACATGTTALRGVWLEIASGLYDVGLALGAEKLFCEETARSISALQSGADMELTGIMGLQFTGVYAMMVKDYMKRTGATQEDFARVVVKNSYNGSLNPNAQYKISHTIEEIINSRLIAWPLTLYMCGPMSDGAAAVVLCAKEVARKYTDKPLVTIESCELMSGAFRYPYPEYFTFPSAIEAAKKAYEKAGIGPKDVDVAEVHDAMAPAELTLYEELGLCKEGESPRLIREGRTALNGDIPVNPSGGLAAKGHPVGATGLAQVAEIVWQLRGEAGRRQIAKPNPQIGLIENAGGFVEDEPAICSITILKKT
jgi:acetyl-CoA acyltransferase